MVKITAIKEVLKALFKSATTKYPKGPPTHVPPGLRGLPEFNKEKCIGCGACFVSCSANAIAMKDDATTRKIDIPYVRCVFCGRCEDICPEEGIALTNQFELATYDKDKASVSIEFMLQQCTKCGAPITTTEHLEKIKERIVTNIDPAIAEEVTNDLPKYMNLCIECRRKMSYELDTHTQKYYRRRWES